VSMSFPFTVRQAVAMGRSPWTGQDAEDDDGRLVAAAMRDTDVSHLADRVFTSLSGGERARAALARVVAQDTMLLLLDEPTAALDVRHQEQVLSLARARADRNCAVVVVMHDLGLAAAHADRVVLLADGRVQADGPPGQVLTDELLGRVYDHPIEVIRHPRTGELLVLPVRSQALTGAAGDAVGPSGPARSDPARRL
jgi:iron complex transport system ATP-binding protein